MGAIRRSPSASELTQLYGIMRLIRDGHPNRRSFEAAASRLRLRLARSCHGEDPAWSESGKPLRQAFSALTFHRTGPSRWALPT